MPKHILRTDDGPDIEVLTEQKVASATIVCGRTGKPVGSISAYKGSNSTVVYITDRRKPVGKNRQAFIFHNGSRSEQVLALCGTSPEVKEILRALGDKSAEVTVSLANCVVSDKQG